MRAIVLKYREGVYRKNKRNMVFPLSISFCGNYVCTSLQRPAGKRQKTCGLHHFFVGRYRELQTRVRKTSCLHHFFVRCYRELQTRDRTTSCLHHFFVRRSIELQTRQKNLQKNFEVTVQILLQVSIVDIKNPKCRYRGIDNAFT